MTTVETEILVSLELRPSEDPETPAGRIEAAPGTLRASRLGSVASEATQTPMDTSWVDEDGENQVLRTKSFPTLPQDRI